MATVTISGQDYPAYCDIAFATQFLAADMARATPWAALTADQKGRAVVTATRLLQRFPGWAAGVAPDIASASTPVQQATAFLAADIAAKPDLGNNASQASNVRRVNGKQAEVEFFRSPGAGLPLPQAAYETLMSAGLLGPVGGADDDTPVFTGYMAESRFRYDRDMMDGWDGC